jgi:hypothetical protein
MQWVLIIMLILGAIGVIIWFAYYYSKNRGENDLPSNPNMVINFMSDDTDGYALGLEIKCTKGKGGRSLVEFLPIDFNTESDERPERQSVIVGKGKRSVLGKGDLSGRREPIFLLPEDVDDIPESLKETAMGGLLQSWIGNINVKNTTVDILNGAIDRIAAIGKNRPLGEASREELGYLNQFMLNALKKIEGGDSNFKPKKGETNNGTKE